MNTSSQKKWNERYQKGAYGTRTHPSALLTEWLPKLQNHTRQIRAVDNASGTGRNSIYLAQHGWQVDAFDIEMAFAVAAAIQKLGEEFVPSDLK